MQGMSNAVEKDSVSRLVLEPRLAAEDAAAFVQSLQTFRGKPLELDASQVAEIGTPCLQVLLSAMVSWRADGQTCAVVEPSDALLAVIGHLGLDLDALQTQGVAA